MARTKHHSAEAERVLSRLRSVTPEARDGMVQLMWIKKALAAAVSDAPRGMKLPPLRDIATACGVALVPAQRAVSELVKEGVLHSAPRSGVFAGKIAAAAPPPGEEDSCPRPFAAFRRRLVFSTDSGWDFQLEFWRGLASDFAARCPNVEVEFKTAPDPTADTGRDVYESSPWIDWCPGKDDDAMDVSALLATESLTVAAHGRGIPLCYRTYYMFFNRQLLRGLGVPEPDYKDFAGQTAYVERLADTCRRAGLQARPDCIYQPVLLLGSNTRTLLDAIRAAPTAIPEAAQNAWRETTRLLRLLRNKHDDHSKDEFLGGRCPLFYGYGVDLWWLLHHPPAFDWAVYPCLCADGALPLWPRLGMVSRRTQFPLEAVRFLEHVASAGLRFAAIGDLPALPGDYHIPHLAADPDWFRALAAQSTPFAFDNRSDGYLAISILNAELWQLVSDPALPPDTALHRAVRQGKAYWSHFHKTDDMN